MEGICSDITGSNTGEMFYKCMAETAGYTHWAGPFFSAFFLGMIVAFVIGMVAMDLR